MIAAGDSAARSLAGCRYLPLRPWTSARPPSDARLADQRSGPRPVVRAAHQPAASARTADAEFWSDERAQPLPLEARVWCPMFQFGSATAWTVDAGPGWKLPPTSRSGPARGCSG
jgi:hypothetical protein